MNIGDRVVIRGLDLVGTIINIRHDDRGDAINTVNLDTPSTPDGLFVARDFELATKAQLRAILVGA